MWVLHTEAQTGRERWDAVDQASKRPALLHPWDPHVRPGMKLGFDA